MYHEQVPTTTTSNVVGSVIMAHKQSFINITSVANGKTLQLKICKNLQ